MDLIKPEMDLYDPKLIAALPPSWSSPYTRTLSNSGA